ncbi:uncharacterized protein LOC121408110 [Lytechinus variegatus]|uniref:uncharacterized protein LOC121408110 n=1 Tax=Lytechinus variegatus TaxID=7654 RepID=UPI001BB252CF|nr:uncharacterized protein LOC121408110 [Lytechinus variegatus]
MQMTLKRAFQTFSKDSPRCKISFAAFAKLRPRSVRLFSRNFHDTCLCVYCANIMYKVQTIKKIVNSGKCQSPRITDEYQLIDLLLCPLPASQRFHKATCIRGECDKCSDLGKKLTELCHELLQSDDGMDVTWNHWERHTMTDGKSKRVLSTKHGTLGDLVGEFRNDVLSPTQGLNFVQHLHTARWQQRQFQRIKDNLPDNVALMVMDFARNRKVFYQDEIKAAYFTQQQVTMHPVVCYYREDGSVVRESVVFLSDDLGHDHHAVNHFLKCTEDYLSANHTINREIIFSDGCTSQYKGRGSFADLSLQTVRTERHFFGSEHGKGEGDGEIGLINKAIDRAILSREVVINSAEEMFTWCCKNLSSSERPSRRKFFPCQKGRN